MKWFNDSLLSNAYCLQGGLVSSWLFDNMHPGKFITFRGIDGDFTLALAAELVKNDRSKNGVLLVAGGIGITPMRVMLAERLAQHLPVTLLYFVRTLQEAPFLEALFEVSVWGLASCCETCLELRVQQSFALHQRGSC